MPRSGPRSIRPFARPVSHRRNRSTEEQIFNDPTATEIKKPIPGELLSAVAQLNLRVEICGENLRRKGVNDSLRPRFDLILPPRVLRTAALLKVREIGPGATSVKRAWTRWAAMKDNRPRRKMPAPAWARAKAVSDRAQLRPPREARPRRAGAFRARAAPEAPPRGRRRAPSRSRPSKADDSGN